MAATFETLLATQRKLVAGGQHPLPDFWLEHGERLYTHPTANTLVARCGRGSVKSGFGSRVALNEVLFGDFEIPDGEVHYWVDLSENKAEAAQRLRQYATYLTILGIPFEPRGDEIVLPGARRGFLARAFQVGKVSGFRGIGFRSDELAKCAFDGAEPAAEVLASARAMTVTHQAHRPKFLLLSSAVGLDDEHARAFARGNTAEQIVCEAPTWIANPSVSEEQTRALEPDLRIWSREYANEPEATITAALDPADANACFALPKAALNIREVGGWSGPELRRVSMEQIVKHITERARKWGAQVVFGDQREEASLTSLFAQNGMAFRSFPWTLASKDDAIMLLRRLMREREISICEHETLKRELLGIKARLLPSGATQYQTNGLDFASAVITLMHAALERRVNGGGFCAIDASSLRGDSFAFVCGNGSVGTARGDARIISIGSERSLGGRGLRVGRPINAPDWSHLSAQERRARFWNDEKRR